MDAIGKIGSTGAISRDTPSAGHDQIDQAEQRAAAPPRNQRVEEVAKMYEKQFLQEMVKAMRGTVSFAEKPGMAENIYKDQLDDQYVDSWGENGGIGLSNMIYEQVMDKYFPQKMDPALRKQGPVQLSDRDVSRVVRLPSEAGAGGTASATNGTQVPLRVELKPSTNGQGALVKAPWDSEVTGRTQLDGRTALTLEHGKGMRSTFIFDGVANADAQPGKKFQQGQAVGRLSPEIQSFFWNLNQRTANAAPEPGLGDAELKDQTSVSLPKIQ
jgi:flagellar protein FlgJ